MSLAAKLSFLDLFTSGRGLAAPAEPGADRSQELSDLRLALGKLLDVVGQWEKAGLGDSGAAWRKQHGTLGLAVDSLAEAPVEDQTDAAFEQLKEQVDGAVGDAAKELAAYEQWATTAARTEKAVLAALKGGKGDLDAIRTTWAFAHGKAEGGDPAAAVKSVEKTLLPLLVAASKATKTRIEEEVGDNAVAVLTAKWQLATSSLTPRVEAALKARIQDESGLVAAWALAAEEGEKGVANASVEALNKALRALSQVNVLLKSATTEQLPTGTVKRATDSLGKEVERKRAVGQHEAAKRLAVLVVKGVKEGLGTTVPVAIDSAITDIEKLYDLGDETDAEKIEQVAERLTVATEKLEEDAKKPIADKRAWEAGAALFEIRLDLLKNHAQSKGSARIKNRIKPIDQGYTAAKVKAGQFDWEDAAKALPALGTACDEATAAADALAELKIIQVKREQLVTPLPAENTLVHDETKRPVAAARKLLTDATDAEGNGDLPAARDFLNLIPDAVAEATEAVRVEKEYIEFFGKLETRLIPLNATSTAVKDLVAPDLEDMNTYVAESDLGTTNNLRQSSIRVKAVWGGFVALETRVGLAKDYVDALTAFDLRHKALADHDGHDAVAGFLARLVADRLLATTLAGKKDFVLAKTTLTSGEGEQNDQLAIAVLGKEYLEKKKKNEEELDRVEKADTAGVAGSPLADARAQIQSAATAATENRWKDAVACAKEAAARLVVAEALVKSSKELTDKKDTGKLDAVATSFSEAYAVYDTMRKHVASKDTDNAFVTLLATADAPAQEATDASKGESPDWGKARAGLDTAIAVCERALPLIGLRAGYLSLDATLKAEQEVTLAGLNDNDCVKREIEALKKVRSDAANLVKAPGFDYPAGLALLATGVPLAQLGHQKAEAFGKWKAKFLEIKSAVTWLKDPSRKAGVAAEITKLEEYRDKVWEHYQAGRMVEAGKVADEGQKLVAAYKSTAEGFVKWVHERDVEIPAVRAPVVGKAACKIEFDAAEVLRTQANDLATKHLYLAACRVSDSAYWDYKGAREKLKAHDAYELARANAETKISDARKVVNDAIADALEALDDRYDKAVALATDERRFIKAMDDITPLAKAAQDLLPRALAAKECGKARNDAAVALGVAAKHPHAKAVAALLLHLKARHEAGRALEAKHDYATAKKLFLALDAQCKAALEEAKEQEKLAVLTDSVKKLPTDDEQKLGEAIVAAVEHRKTMLQQPSAMAAVGPMVEAHEALVAAQKAHDEDKLEEARTNLKAALDACTRGQLAMGRYSQIASEAKAVGDDLTDLGSAHAQKAFVQAEIVEAQKKLEAALYTVRSTGAWEEANKAISAVDADARRLRGAADAQVLYLAERKKVEVELDKLEKHKHRYAAVDQIKKIREALDDAEKKSVAHEHPAAQKAIAKAAELARIGMVKLTCHADQTPDVGAVKTILDGADGPDTLDEIVNGLEGDTKRKVLRVAFEARFGCKLNVFATKNDEKAQIIDADLEKRTPNIRKFYDLMAKLPLADTRDNESMAVFVEVEQYKGSDFGSRKVTMREGKFGKSADYGVGLKHEVGKVDGDSEPVGDHRPTYFEWNTVHEVGHAVDDRAGFMSKRGEELGGWKTYGGNVAPIAAAVAKHFDYDEAYVLAYMSGQTPAIVAPVGCEPDEWERRRAQCQSWVDSARSGKDPWSTEAQANALAIKGVVYHESYDDDWASYPLAQRKKAVSGYQFRAPGEWFAELYAAYHTKKLNPSHPANKWLAKL